MEENVIKVSWVLTALLVVFAFVHKPMGIGLTPGATSINSSFNLPNTCLLFGILFTLNNRP